MDVNYLVILTTMSIICGLTGLFSGLLALIYSSIKVKTLKTEILTASQKNLTEGLEELRVVSQNDAIELFNHFLNKGPESQDPLRDFSFKNFWFIMTRFLLFVNIFISLINTGLLLFMGYLAQGKFEKVEPLLDKSRNIFTFIFGN